MAKTITLERDIFGYGFALANEHPCTIDFVMPHSVASAAGLCRGDLLVEVNGINVETLSHDQVSSLVWSSSSVHLKIIAAQSCETGGSIASKDTGSPGSGSPLFTGLPVSSRLKRSAVVQYVDKLTVDLQLGVRCEHIARKLIPLKQKAFTSCDIKLDSVCLFEIFSDYLKIYFPTKTFEYCANDLSLIAALEEDRRFFFLLTRGRQKLKPTDGQSTSAEVTSAIPASCCLFRCLPPKYLGHRGHTDIVKVFNILCHRDRLTGECAEFPRTVYPLVQDISDLISNTPGVFRTPIHISSSVVNHLHPSTTAVRSKINRVSHGLQTLNPKADRNVLTARITPALKRPTSLNRTSSSRFLGHLSRAASYLKDRWRDRRGSLVQQSPTNLRSDVTLSARNESRTSFESVDINMDARPFSVCDSLFSLTEDSSDSTMDSSCTPRAPRSSRKLAAPEFRAFDELLSNPAGLRSFREFLTSEFSSENLDFWCTVREWRTRFPDPNSSTEARAIFATFLSPESPQAVNVDSSVVKHSAAFLRNPSRDMFSEAEGQVYQLMKMDSFPRFLASPYYHSLVALFSSNVNPRPIDGPTPGCVPYRKPQNASDRAVRCRAPHSSSTPPVLRDQSNLKR